VLAMGGLGSIDEIARDGRGVPLLPAYAAGLTGRPAPRICLLGTAMGDDAGSYLRGYQLFGPVAGRVTHLQLFPMPNTADPEDLLLSADLIFVGGGSVANMLAVWRVHGLDQIMRKAWQAGTVLSGVSAGAICWFTGGTTDSFGVELRPFTGGLALLAPSYCPHYDSEPRRRPLYQSLVAGGDVPAGIACDDGAAAHYADDELAAIVTDRRGAHGYRVEPLPGGQFAESELPARFLGDR
jgi:peptidase E